ncbi:uncharacterized protein F4817DRAFT_331388 [Daldinia loculata]|uniref:uncharacterized protein n=1 Tax=Daldinia loculata TaxID=103429 RepID=UPI0020C58505|nr:uncharacterized protein F4817DRAFT_331388 [Daldinia loculata]KAI1649330.1 hypothetical protein F4817DRAFT_331388 [Daldinia loculata]
MTTIMVSAFTFITPVSSLMVAPTPYRSPSPHIPSSLYSLGHSLKSMVESQYFFVRISSTLSGIWAVVSLRIKYNC